MSNFQKYLIATAVALATVASSACADSMIPDDVAKAVEHRVANRYCPSIVLGVVGPNGVEFLARGDTKWLNGQPVSPDTIYEIGSITKAFTGDLLADMVLRGEVSLDDPIDKYLPANAHAPSRDGKNITLADLAEHASGLPRMPDNMKMADPQDPYADYTVAELYEFLAGYELPRAIGQKYEYSNLGGGLLGHALALRAGKPYKELIVERIAKPLEMSSTRVDFNETQRERFAGGHSGAESAGRWHLPTLAGAGDLESCARDMLRFVAAHLGLESTPLAEAMALAVKPRHEAGSQDMQIGLFWHIKTHNDNAIVWHNGGTGGFRSFCGFSTKRKLGVVLLTNDSLAGVDDLGFHLLEPDLPIDGQWDRPTQRIKPQQLANLAGRYELRPGFNLDMAPLNGFLTVKATGQQRFTLYATSPTEFFLNVLEAGCNFQLGDDGKATSLTWHQGGDAPAKRTGDVPEEKVRKEINVATDVLDRYVGDYAFPGGTIHVYVTRDGDQLFARVTNQMAIPIFAESETDFFYKVVEAAITFECDGKSNATALVLHQGGRDQRATRTE